MKQITKNKTAGIYIHIPFCLSKCDYCDFASFGGVENKEEYISALLLDIQQKSTKYHLGKIDTIYLGGGTPSILSVSQIKSILSATKEHFEVCENCEITIEVNPKTANGEKLQQFKDMGINRVSVGVQSFFDSELSSVHRTHTAEEGKSILEIASNIFDNFSLDLMLGLPTSTMKSVFHSVKTALSYNPTHISVYGLQVEEGTKLHENVANGLQIPREDTLADMFELCENLIKEAGYSHYEISNFAKEGFESKHNLGYWKLKDYLGIGLSSHSLVGLERFFAPSTIAEYISAVHQNNCEIPESTLEIADAKKEYTMLGLRLKAGVNTADYFSMFSSKFQDDFSDPLEKMKPYLEISNNHVRIPEKYFYVSNQIISEFM